MSQSTDTKTINDLCLVSRQGVCLLDMKQVAEAAKLLGLLGLVELIETDLSQNKVRDGQYYPVIQSLLGV